MSVDNYSIEGNTISIYFDIKDNIYDIIRDNKLFKKIFKVNRDLLKNYYNDNNKYAYVFKNITDENIDEYKYISFKTNTVWNDKYNVTITGLNSNKFFDIDDNIEKITIEKLLFNIHKSDNRNVASFKLTFINGEIPMYTKKLIGKILNKCLTKFKDSI